jgi:hypothetical protein
MNINGAISLELAAEPLGDIFEFHWIDLSSLYPRQDAI